MAVVRYRAEIRRPPKKAEYGDPQKRIRWSVQGVRRIANKRAQRRVEPAEVIAWSRLRPIHQAAPERAYLKSKMQP